MAVLGNLIEQVRGVSYKPEDLHNNLNENSVVLLRANNIKDGEVNFDDVVYVDRKKVSDKQFLKAGDILICASSGSKELVGKAAYLECNLPMTFGAFCKVVRPKTECSKYIGHFFNSPYYRERIANSAAGANINNIRNEHIDVLEIVWPSVEEQHSAVTVLDKVTELITMRKEQLAKLDQLVKSRFIELFDRYTETTKLSEVATVTGGLTKNSKRNQLPLRMPYLRVANVAFASIDVTEMLDIGLTRDEYEKTLLEYEDMLFVEGNGSPDQIGRVAIWRNEITPCVHQNHLIKARFNQSKVKPVFAMHYFMSQSGREQIKSKAVSTSGLFTLSVSKVADLLMPVPPMDIQEDFVAFVEQTDKSKLAIQQSLEKLETLKKSLMQQYFG